MKLNKPLTEAWVELMGLGFVTDSDLLREMVRTFYREKFHKDVGVE